MAIVRTNYAEVYTGATSVTLPFTTSGYYRGLLVSVKVGGAVGPTITVATYGGVSLTLINSQNLNTTQRTGNLFYLENPALGLNDLIITSGNANVEAIQVISYRNVLQSGLINVSAAGSDGSGSIDWNLTTTINDAWAVSLLANNSSDPFSDGTYVTFLGVDSSFMMGDSNGSLGASGSKSLSVPDPGTNAYYYFSAAIAPAVTIPILTTSAASSIALTAARLNGEVLYDGDATITERGFVYNTLTSPTVANSKKIVTGTVGTYNGDITGLTVNTTYYVRSYAINANGTAYGNEISFTTLNIGQYELQREIGAVDGLTYVGQINVTGTLGTITVKLGTTGTSTVIAAGAGVAAFSGTYNGLSGLIITRSADFNGTIDNVYYAQVPLGTAIDFSLDSVTIVTAINSSVFFKRIEDDVFNSFRFYRYLDLLFKDLDGYVTVTVRDEREDVTTERTKTFSVGNTSSGTVSPFQKKRVSFLIKNQAVIIGLSNGNVGETFSIAQFLLTGHKKTQRMFAPSKIQSL